MYYNFVYQSQSFLKDKGVGLWLLSCELDHVSQLIFIPWFLSCVTLDNRDTFATTKNGRPNTISKVPTVITGIILDSSKIQQKISDYIRERTVNVA